MRKELAATLVLLCAVIAAQSEGKTKIQQWPVNRGTINVVVANDQGIVLLTDSMLTQTRYDQNGVIVSVKQSDTPGQKLFQIDDRTVCAFAGFAFADTSPVPDFLNSVSSIMGRYKDRLKTTGPLTLASKFTLLEEVFSYYLGGIANIRARNQTSDYEFQLLMAGYDSDGTPQIGRLVLGIVFEQERTGSVFRTITLQRNFFQVGHRQMICVNGINDVADETLRIAGTWNRDREVVGCEESTTDTKLTLEQMKALAVSLKQRTADRHREVGGPNQIAVLTGGRVQNPIEQPAFPSVDLAGFKFNIVATFTADNSSTPGEPTAYGYAFDVFTLFFANRFLHVKQELDEAYYSGNIFMRSRLIYRGGRIQLETSNHVIDCDLEIAKGVSPNSPEVKQLLKEFKWHAVKYGVAMAPRV